MRNLATMLVHFIITIARFMGPGGARSVVAESLLIKHQLLILNRSRTRAPALLPADRFFLGMCSLFMHPTRLMRSAIVLKPATILSFHKALVNRKYRLLFSHNNRSKPGPKGPSHELVSAIIDMKSRNPQFGYQRIADQLSQTFNIDVDKDVVRRVLATHYCPEPGSGGPSWLTFLGHSKDSLWSVDLFRFESIILRSHWVMVVMDHYSRRIIGIAVHAGTVDGRTLCCLFNRIISGSTPPRNLSLDNDPLFTFHRWRANLRILDVEEVKTVPYVPLSHPFIERLIGTLRREFLDHVPFWGALDLERKLNLYRKYYNTNRTHRALNGTPPAETIGKQNGNVARLHNYHWQNHCRGLYQLPVAA